MLFVPNNTPQAGSHNSDSRSGRFLTASIDVSGRAKEGEKEAMLVSLLLLDIKGKSEICGVGKQSRKQEEMKLKICRLTSVVCSG